MCKEFLMFYSIALVSSLFISIHTHLLWTFCFKVILESFSVSLLFELSSMQRFSSA